MNELESCYPGPYIQVAAFCEQVLQEKDGVISLIRIIDTLTHTEAGPNPPEQMPPITWNMKLVLMLKPGLAIGRHEIKVTPQSPSGQSKNSFTTTIYFEGSGNRGANVILELPKFCFDEEGLHWFGIYFDNSLLTRIPFEVKYLRIVRG